MPERDQHEISKTRRALVRRRTHLEVGRLLAMALLVASVWAVGYQGRADLVKTQRLGCERGKLDRRANAAGWRFAERSRQVADQRQDLEAAGRYAEIAAELEERGRVNCAVAYPSPRLLPWGRSVPRLPR